MTTTITSIVADKMIRCEKHGLGVVVDINNEIDKTYGYEPSTKTFYSGIDPAVVDVQRAVASKKRLMEYWKRHSPTYPIRNEKGVVDSGKVIKMIDGGFDILKSPLHIIDHSCEEFPFKLNSVDQFTLETSELHSFKNTPRVCNIGQFGTAGAPMRYVDSLVGGPIKAKTLSLFTKSTMLNLENSLEHDIESLIITAPDFASFEGLNPNIKIQHLSLITRNQKTFKGIHRAIKSNVKVVCASVREDFEGGVLPFAMLDPGIEILPDVSNNPPVGFTEAMDVVSRCRKEGLNVHDIQERLIDVGLGKYARL